MSSMSIKSILISIQKRQTSPKRRTANISKTKRKYLHWHLNTNYAPQTLARRKSNFWEGIEA